MPGPRASRGSLVWATLRPLALPIQSALAAVPSRLAARCREKEAQRLLQMQEKQAMRLRQREAVVTGPKDDADLEWDALLASYRAQNW